MIRVTRCYRFPAAHVLRRPELSDAENERLYGKCAHPAGHGHDYGMEVTVTGSVDERTGWIVAPERLDALVRERVLDRFEHRLLNEDALFRDTVPTAENIARTIYAELEAPLLRRTGARLVRVKLRETRRNHFEVGLPRFGAGEPR